MLKLMLIEGGNFKFKSWGNVIRTRVLDKRGGELKKKIKRQIKNQGGKPHPKMCSVNLPPPPHPLKSSGGGGGALSCTED